jgi:hypothetical protein
MVLAEISSLREALSNVSVQMTQRYRAAARKCRTGRPFDFVVEVAVAVVVTAVNDGTTAADAVSSDSVILQDVRNKSRQALYVSVSSAKIREVADSLTKPWLRSSARWRRQQQ